MFDPTLESDLDRLRGRPLADDEAGDDALPLLLRVRDPELVEELGAIADPREREAVALAAPRIGWLALRTARGQVDAQAVRGEVERMLGELRSGLDAHRTHLQEQLGRALREYFDPEGGRFEERVRRLVHDDGELATVIRSQVSGSDSALARTLAQHVGEGSALLRTLDPANAEGLVAGINRLVDDALGAQRKAILGEFSLDNREGALARLVVELTQSHGRLSEALSLRIDAVVKEFSLDAEDSALSRLVQRVERAQQQISAEFTLDSETSALARLRREWLAIAERQAEQLGELQKKVEVELAKLTTTRERDARTTAHGNAFEAALLRWLEQRAIAQGDVFEATGQTTGVIRNCKKGDAVVELGPQQRAAGARIVVEAKEEAGFTLARARAELEEARKNRSASAGVFVLSARSAPAGWPVFHALGEDVFAVWDLEDPASDVRLEAALAVARALATRGRGEQAAQVDLEAFERAIRDVEKQLQGLDEIQTSAGTIESGASRIKERARILRGHLVKAIERLDEGFAAARRELTGGQASPAG
jgi:hypothetical protein